MSDIFDDEDADETAVTAQDWKRMREDRTKSGYREGVSEGRDARIQEGFDRGFKENLELYQSLGYMSGVLRGLLALKDSQDIPPISDSSRAAILSVIERIDQLKRAEPVKQTPPGDSSNTGNGGRSSGHQSSDDPATVEDSPSKDMDTTDDVERVRTDFTKLLKDMELSDLGRSY